jgi:DDE family transposase
VKWHIYNQSLVRRGELLLAFDIIDNWDSELKQMNKDKVGEPFYYPNTFLLLLGYTKVYFHLPYRQTEGIAPGHAKGKVPSIPHYTTISRRRIIRLNIKVEDTVTKESKDNYIIIAIDSTGIKITNRGQWLRDKWNIRKGYLKIHVAVDTKSKKILSVKVTDEHIHDSKMLPKLVEGAKKSNHISIGKVFADGAYDSNAVFTFLAENGILPC